jgi:hypothetical protein
MTGVLKTQVQQRDAAVCLTVVLLLLAGLRVPLYLQITNLSALRLKTLQLYSETYTIDSIVLYRVLTTHCATVAHSAQATNCSTYLPAHTPAGAERSVEGSSVRLECPSCYFHSLQQLESFLPLRCSSTGSHGAVQHHSVRLQPCCFKLS